MAINETLKFSWGHIIAFVTLIFISYISFMGITYLSDGDFLYAGIGVLIINLLITTFFILPQILKGTERKFSRKIVFERILIISSPFVFAFAMGPYTHFWNVLKKKDVIEYTFSKSIKTTKGMFDAYEKYANARIAHYDMVLAREQIPAETRRIKVEALKLQLTDKNYTSLKSSAFEWIDNASNATVWNVFTIGNIKEIENALELWNSSLVKFSSKKMEDEGNSTIAFSSTDESINTAKENLNNLTKDYTQRSGLNTIALLTEIFLYLLLLLPYIIQNRNTKSTYRLFGTEHSHHAKTRHKEEDKLQINISNEEDGPSNSDDYGSFTM